MNVNNPPPLQLQCDFITWNRYFLVYTLTVIFVVTCWTAANKLNLNVWRIANQEFSGICISTTKCFRQTRLFLQGLCVLLGLQPKRAKFRIKIVDCFSKMPISGVWHVPDIRNYPAGYPESGTCRISGRISGIRWRDQILIRSWSGGQILDPAQP